MKKNRRKPDGPAPSVMEMRAGPGPRVSEVGGRTWQLGWNDQDAKAELESLIVSHATEEAVKRMGSMSAEGARVYFEFFQNRVDAGQYSTFAPGWTHTMASQESSGLFLLSLLRRHHPDATAEDASRLLTRVPEKVRIAVGLVAPDFFEAVVRQVGVETGATAERVRAAAVQLAESLLAKFSTPLPTAEPVTD